MNKTIRLLIIMLCLSLYGQAQQPYAGCWYPRDIKNWTPEKFSYNKYNRATVKLQPRFVDKTIKANPNARFSDAKICPDLTLTKDCSKAFAQGTYGENAFDKQYVFNYWQYTDMIVWWGGSSGEGVFICPTGPAIDAAHKNGVKMLANIFFPPREFGGSLGWISQTLETDDKGNYIIADKLIEIAEYFGFDGWFINEETNLFSDRSNWVAFLKYFQKKAKGKNLHIQIYSASATFKEKDTWGIN